MMNPNYAHKLRAGAAFPELEVTLDRGTKIQLGKAAKPGHWQMVVVYRGKHCPLCTKYLNQLEKYTEQLAEIGVELIAVSGDSQNQLNEHLVQLNVTYPIAYGFTVEQMEELGMYISMPRSAQETDHPFAEPGVFVVNENGQLHLVDISNNPFVRPELETLVKGLAWLKNPDNHYPIRGTKR